MINHIKDSLTEIEKLIPSKAWKTMQTVEIYVNKDYRRNGKLLSGACNHWSAGWLEANGDLIEKEGHVEIFNIGDLLL